MLREEILLVLEFAKQADLEYEDDILLDDLEKYIERRNKLLKNKY